MQPKIWSINVFLTLNVRGPFHRKDFKWKKIWGYGVNFWENEAFYVELNKRVEAAILQYSCSITMINVCEGKFMNQTSWSNLLLILSHKHRINILQKVAWCRITTSGCFCFENTCFVNIFDLLISRFKKIAWWPRF